MFKLDGKKDTGAERDLGRPPKAEVSNMELGKTVNGMEDFWGYCLSCSRLSLVFSGKVGSTFEFESSPTKYTSIDHIYKE